jgi:hypothetical protein
MSADAAGSFPSVRHGDYHHHAIRGISGNSVRNLVGHFRLTGAGHFSRAPKVNRAPRRFSPGDPGLRRVTPLDDCCYSNVTAKWAPVRGRLRVRGLLRRPDGDFSPGGGVKRSWNLLDGQGVEDLTRDLGWLTEGFFCYGELTAALGACLRKQAPCLRKREPVETRVKTVDGDERSRNVTDTEGLLNLSWFVLVLPWRTRWQFLAAKSRRSAARRLAPHGRSNEAGILLIAEHLRIYLGNSADSGPWTPSRRPGE